MLNYFESVGIMSNSLMRLSYLINSCYQVSEFLNGEVPMEFFFGGGGGGWMTEFGVEV